MKTTKDLLKESFASIPNNFAYRDVKFYVYHALQKLETIEKREGVKEKQKREEQIKEEKRRKSQSWMPPIYQNVYQTNQLLGMVDKMISEEKKIIEGIQNKNKGHITKSEPHNDDEDGLQTLHG